MYTSIHYDKEKWCKQQTKPKQTIFYLVILEFFFCTELNYNLFVGGKFEQTEKKIMSLRVK